MYCLFVFFFASLGGIFDEGQKLVEQEVQNKKIVAVNHDDLLQSDYIGTRQIYEKYGYTANFNFILSPFSSVQTKTSKVEHVKKLISNGNHLGLHAVMGSTFWWMNKLYDVRPDGTSTFAPTLQEVKTPVNNGNNIFGYETVGRKISQMGFVTLPTTVSSMMIDDMTEDDYKKVIRTYSFYFNKETSTGIDLNETKKTMSYLHWLEYWYNELIDNSMGYSTSLESVNEQFLADYAIPSGSSPIDYYTDATHLENGKIVFFDDTNNANYNNPNYQKVGRFKRGLFKGCASTCNYEVADRLIDIAKAFCKHYFGTDTFTNYGRHGVRYVKIYWTDDDSMPYDNREKTIVSGEVGRFYHSRTGKFLTGHDILLEEGITMLTGPTNPRTPLLESQIGLYYGQSGIRYPYFNASLYRDYLCLMGTTPSYSSTKISNDLFNYVIANQDNLLKFFYESSGKTLAGSNGETVYIYKYFKTAIDHIRSCIGTGKIASLSFDTIKDDPSVLNAVELLALFIDKIGFHIVPFETARQFACNKEREPLDNYFPNPDFENSLLTLFGGVSSVSDAYLPDGWNVDTGHNNGYTFNIIGEEEKALNISNHSGSSLSISTKIFGLPAGNYQLSFRAKGDATLKLFLKKNGDFISQYYGNKTRFNAEETITSNNDNYKEYTILFSIPAPHVNDYSYGGSIINQFAHGYEDNISNVKFSISVANTKNFSLFAPQLSRIGGDDSISTITTEVKDCSDDWYNLYGQKVMSPNKGIYIHNGRKIIINKYK